MRIFILFISFILINISAFPQIYTLQRGERVKDGYILDENNFAVIIEKTDINNQKTFDIIYKDKRLTGYKDAGIIKILPNNILVATMLKSSTGKDMWTLIYGDKEMEFDSIERSDFSGNNSIIFARLTDYGIAIINGERQTEYSELFCSIIDDNDFAFSYLRDGEYFININGEETQIDGKVDRMKYSTYGDELIYIIEVEESSTLSNNDTDIFLEVVDFVSFDANNYADSVKFMPEIDTNDINNSIITNASTTNTSMITNYNLSNISVYTNEEGITVKGQSDTIALMIVTNIITNFISLQMPEIPQENITNAPIMTSLILNGRNLGEYNLITNMSFSPDGKTLLFIDIDTNENLSFHVGGETITNYDNILLYKYSADSKSFAYAAQTNGNSFIILNGKRLNKDFNNINELYFSSNNNLVYNATKGDRQYIFTDDFESPSYNNINSFKFIGESFAFTGERLGKYYYFILDKENLKRREFGGYDFVSAINEETDSAISIISDGKNIFIIKDGNIINNR